MQATSQAGAGTRHKVTILGVVKAFFVAVLAFAGIGSHAQDNTVNLSSTIRGNQEQPKVLYIVPWKAVDNAELENQTIQSQLDIVFGHVERVELRRELTYLENLAGTEKETEK